MSEISGWHGPSIAVLASALAVTMAAAQPAAAQSTGPNGQVSPQETAQQAAANAAGSTGAAAPTINAVSGGDGSRLQEIVVTARKREETLNSVPLSVSAFGAAQIAARGIVDLNQVSDFTPGFHFQNQVANGSGRNDRTISTLTFRGLVLSNDTDVRAGGLLFVDGAPVIGGQVPPTADIERVEILRGPQSAFFGRSTFSGAVNYVTKEPPSHYSGDAAIGGGSYGSNFEQVSVGGPLLPEALGDTLRAKITFYHNEKGGEWTNAASPNQKLGEQETTAFSANVLWAPNEKLRVRGAATYFIESDGPPAQFELGQNEFTCSPGGTANKYLCGNVPSADKVNQSLISGNYTLDAAALNATVRNRGTAAIGPFPTFFNTDLRTEAGLERHAIQASIRIDYTLPYDFVVTSVSAYQSDKAQALLDIDFRDATNIPNASYVPGVSEPYLRYFGLYQTLFSSYNQELRVTSPQDRRIRGLIGGNVLVTQSNMGDVFGLGPAGPAFFSVPVKLTPTTSAAFGAIYFDILPTLTLSGELRYQIDDVRETVLAKTTGASFAPSAPPVLAKSYDSLSPRVNLEYKFADHSLVYTLWSRGYRPGGFNVALTPPTNTPAVIAAIAAQTGATVAYDQERLDNYEVGLKTLLFDGRVQINGDVYYDDYTNGQVSQLLNYVPVAGGTTNASNFVRNTGKIILHGIEGDATWQVSRKLQLNITGAYNFSRVKSGFCSDCIGILNQPALLYPNSLNGKHLQQVPQVTGTFGAEYSDHLFHDYSWFSRIDYVYRGKEFVDQANVASIGAKNTLNLRLGLRNERFSAEIFCQNCTNDLTEESAQYASTDVTNPFFRQQIRFGLPDKRTIGVRVGAKF